MVVKTQIKASKVANSGMRGRKLGKKKWTLFFEQKQMLGKKNEESYTSIIYL